MFYSCFLKINLCLQLVFVINIYISGVTKLLLILIVKNYLIQAKYICLVLLNSFTNIGKIINQRLNLVIIKKNIFRRRNFYIHGEI